MKRERKYLKKKLKCLRKRVMALGLASCLLLGGCGQAKGGEETKNTTQSEVDDVLPDEFVRDYEDVNEPSDIGLDIFNDVEADTGINPSTNNDNYGVAYNMPDCSPSYPGQEYDVREYDDFKENSWNFTSVTPLSTFAADVDTASYANIRNYILNVNAKEDLPASAVRIEEMINYFNYDFKEPKGKEKFAVETEYMDCPWNEESKLAMVSVNTKEIDFREAPPSNLVFLIDTSGSMFDSNKLPLIQTALTMLVENLDQKDRVSIVTYAGKEAVIIEGVKGSSNYEIVNAIESLESWGSTNGEAGINMAYQIAEKYFIEGGNNRIILATDGDLNVGVSSEGELERLITEKKETGVFLSVLGVGTDNLKDNKLETLADYGNGNYSYLDSIYEAKKSLVEEMGATLVAVAKDVKLQVEFNPNKVKAYRLIGYENRVMAAEDFNNDKKDGGEMGAGHSVVAIYEVALIDSKMEFDYDASDLKYTETKTPSKDYKDELFTVAIRYKEVDKDVSKLIEYICDDSSFSKDGSENLRWAAAVASFGMCLKQSEYLGNGDITLVKSLVESVDYSNDKYKDEFRILVELYDALPNSY